MMDLLLRLVLLAAFTALGVAGLIMWQRGPVPVVGAALVLIAVVDLLLLVLASDG